MASNETFEDSCYYHQFSSAETWLTSIAYVILIIASVVGNCLVTWVVYSSPQMRKPCHYFIVNMAFADFIITVFAMPVAAREQIRNSLSFDFGGVRGEIYCKLLEYTKDVSIASSILTLVAIATDRFCATLIPLKRLITLTRAKVIMVVIWVVSFIVGIPMLVVTTVFKAAENTFFCAEDWRKFGKTGAAKLEASYTIVLFLVLYTGPLVIISILYGVVIRKVWKRTIPGQPTVSGRKIQQRTKKHVLKVFITVVVCFMVCWLPYHVMFFAYKSQCPPPLNLWVFARFLGHANSAITPWIYIVYGRDYRLAVKNKLKQILGNLCPSYLSRNKTVRWEFQFRSESFDKNDPNTDPVTLKSFSNNIDIEQ